MVLDCEFHEDQVLTIRFWGKRDASTGRWDITAAQPVGFQTPMGGQSDVDCEITFRTAAAVMAFAKEAAKHHDKAEEALEKDYQDSRPVDGIDPRDERI